MIHESIFHASYAQRRLWFIQQLAPQGAAYNMLVSMPLPRGIDPAWVQEALDALVSCHEGLRTSFERRGDDVVQRVASAGRVPLHVHRLGNADSFSAAVSAAASQPFDLAQAPLARAYLGIATDSETVLSLVVHHIIADGQSLRILLDDLAGVLMAKSKGQSPSLPPPLLDYADYAVWQRKVLTGRKFEDVTAYWRNRLDGLSELKLFHDRDRPVIGTWRGGVVRFRIGPSVVESLRALAAAARTTLFGVLLAGFSALLARLTGQSDIAVGIPVSGRDRTELERVVGLFVNSLVFRACVHPEDTFLEFARAVGADLASDLSHQAMPFERLVDTLRISRRANVNPLFQVMLQLQVDPKSATDSNLRGPQIDADELSSQLDLSFMLFDNGGDGIEGGAVFSRDLFDESTIEAWVQAFLALLGDVAREPSLPVGKLSLVSENRAELLDLSHGQVRSWPGPARLDLWFEDQASATPDAVAVEADDGLLSYVELDDRADAVARRLRQLDIGPGCVVAVYLSRSLNLAVTLLGITKAGAAYLLLDVAAPGTRRDYILRDSDAAALISAGDDGALAFQSLDHRRQEPPDADASPAYIIYTSGSTGEPKGVAIPHAAILNHMRWMIETFGFGPGERILQRTPVTFDASVWEFWAPLLSGGTLVLAPDETHFDPDRLLAFVREQRINSLQVVPSLLRTLLDRPSASHENSLRRVFVGGEALSTELARRCGLTFGVEVHNLYGPSETTIDATWHPCPMQDHGAADMPIGRPIANVSAYVLDAGLEPVPAGSLGELYIGGAAVGLGYLNRPALNAERFLANPHGPGRLFRTGDRAVRTGDGVLRFFGRSDNQVKVRGFRIELGEIEAMLLRNPTVAEAVAAVQEHDAGDRRLVAFVRLKSNQLASSAELLAWLRTQLPPHMIPGAIGIRTSLPRTAHGKLDRAALASQRIEALPRALPLPAARSARDAAFCNCFAAVLGVDDIDPDEDFFALGGHSLLAVELQAVLSDALGHEVSIVDIFEYPTARRLSQALYAKIENGDRPILRSSADIGGTAS